MYVVGLTGGVGSGKTAVSEHLSQYGIDVVDADVVAREVVMPGSEALEKITAHFGNDVLLSDGALNRALLREKVFSDSAEKAWLEQLLHPLIGVEIRNQLAASLSPYVLLVSPLLVEAGQVELCDRVVVVDVPEATQVERTCRRDNNTKEQVQKILAAQMSRTQRLQRADDVIENTGDIASLHRKVEAIHNNLLDLAAAKQQEPGVDKP